MGHPVWIERTGYIDIDSLIMHVTIEDVVEHHVQTQEYQNKILFPRHVRSETFFFSN